MADILLIDDSEFDRQLVQILLRREPEWTGTTCGSGEEALEILEQRSFDLVITDLKMPGMDGLEVIRQIRTRYPSLPVILITSHGNEDTALLALHQGAANYIPKRALASRLGDAVQTVLTAAHREQQEDQALQFLCARSMQFVLPSDRTQVAPLVTYLQNYTTQHNIVDAADAVRLGVALEEALMNAIIHGNLEVSSDLREGEGRLYDEFIELHATQEPFCHRRVILDVVIGQEETLFCVTDEGPGFDLSQVPDPTDPENLLRSSGRGLLLIQAFMDEVEFNRRANSITMRMKRRPEQARNIPDESTEVLRAGNGIVHEGHAAPVSGPFSTHS